MSTLMRTTAPSRIVRGIVVDGSAFALHPISLGVAHRACIRTKNVYSEVTTRRIFCGKRIARQHLALTSSHGDIPVAHPRRVRSEPKQV